MCATNRLAAVECLRRGETRSDQQEEREPPCADVSVGLRTPYDDVETKLIVSIAREM